MEKKYNENEAENYYEKSFPKVLFDSLGSNNQCDGIDVNNRTKDGTNETNSKARKVIRIYQLYICDFYSLIRLLIL